MVDVVELFAGPGGMSEGLRLAGVDPDEMVGFEWEKWACATAEAAGHRRVQGDLMLIDPHEYVGARGLHSSAPCQGLTLAGKGAGREDISALIEFIESYAERPEALNRHHLAALEAVTHDERSVLTALPLWWIAAILPEWVTFEQVPSALPIWEAFARTLRAWGYSVWTGSVQAEQYGVPQTRKRAFLRASRVKQVGPPTPTHSKYHSRSPERLDVGVEKWVSMAEALSNREGWALRSNYSAGGSAGATAAERGRTMRSAADAPATTIASKGFTWVPEAAVDGDTSWTYRRPSPTIVGSFAPDVVAAPGWRKAGDGPRQKQPGSVRVTVEEAGVLQSFRPDYPWQGPKGKKYQQVGNAVPPLLGAAMVKDLL